MINLLHLPIHMPLPHLSPTHRPFPPCPHLSNTHPSIHPSPQPALSNPSLSIRPYISQTFIYPTSIHPSMSPTNISPSTFIHSFLHPFTPPSIQPFTHYSPTKVILLFSLPFLLSSCLLLSTHYPPTKLILLPLSCSSIPPSNHPLSPSLPC